MIINQVYKYCCDLAREYGYELTVPVVENGRLKRTLGRVKYKNNNGVCIPIKIEFSKKLLSSDKNLIIDTIKHEMAHYFVLIDTKQNHKHDAVWKKWAIKLGCNPQATTCLHNEKSHTETAKYMLKCSQCQKVIGLYKRKGKVINNASQYRSKCCKGQIEVYIRK